MKNTFEWEHYTFEWEHYDHPRYKYKLTADYQIILPISFTYINIFSNYEDIHNNYVSIRYNIYREQELYIVAGYAWDGPSGPTIDTRSFMRGSLVHDALYQLMRARLLSTRCRKAADKWLYKIIREDGMNWFRAKYIYLFVRMFARHAVDPE